MAINDFEQGDGTQFAGTIARSAIDDEVKNYLQVPLKRLLAGYREGAVVKYASAATLTVTTGGVTCASATGALRMRQNTSAVTVAWTDIDTGSEAASTYYYVYAVADADAATFTIKVSTSSSAPTSVTYYRRLGWFYNDSSSNILVGNVGNVPEGSAHNTVQAIGSTDITCASTTYKDMTDMICYYVCHGKPVLIMWEGPLNRGTAEGGVYVAIDVGGTIKKATWYNITNMTNTVPAMVSYLEALTAGTQTIKIQWKEGSSGTAQQDGSTRGARVLTIMEL